MKLELKRHTFSEKSTLGTLTDVSLTPPQAICSILEDKDRQLEKYVRDGDNHELMAHKIYGKTAIPRGTYEIVVTQSQRFARKLPLLLNVPGFEGIRIHPGNTPADTEGCLLPGFNPTADFVGQSRLAFDVLFNRICATIDKGEKVSITIK